MLNVTQINWHTI